MKRHKELLNGMDACERLKAIKKEHARRVEAGTDEWAIWTDETFLLKLVADLEARNAEGLIRENNLQFELMNRRREIDSLRKDIEDRTGKAAE